MAYIVLLLGAISLSAYAVAKPTNNWNGARRDNGRFGGTFNYVGGLGKAGSGGPTGLYDGFAIMDFSKREYGKGSTDDGSKYSTEGFDSVRPYDDDYGVTPSYGSRGDVSPGGTYGAKDYDGGKYGGSDFRFKVPGGDGEESKQGGGYYGKGGYGSRRDWELYDAVKPGSTAGSLDVQKLFTDNNQFMTVAKYYLDKLIEQRKGTELKK